MKLYPAIDLKDGQCVRLLRGDMEQATVFSDNPAGQARLFAEQGAEFLHVVDLNGAFKGEPVNQTAVLSILEAVDIPLQLGGGIRNINMITLWLTAGVNRVILGTAALRDSEMVKKACQKFPNKIIVGIDAIDGMVATEGWAEKSEITAIDLARKFEDVGVASIIYTNINRDGAMEGPDLEGTKLLAESISIPVIASGGVSSLADLRALKSLEQYGVEGVISGRAIYDGKLDIKEAVQCLKRE